jgi:hypothetical protein
MLTWQCAETYFYNYYVNENILPANATNSYSDVLGRKSSAAIEKGSAIFIADFEELKLLLPHLNPQNNNSET